MQQRVYWGSSEGMGEIEQAAADDIDAVVDPSLRDTMYSMSAMNGSFSTGTAPLQCSAATSLSTSRVPSTGFVDKLVNLDMIVAQLADKFDHLALQSRDSVEFKLQIEELTQENHTLRATVEDHHAAIHELQTTIDAQSTSLEELLVLIDEPRSSGNALPTVRSVNKATKAMCDNVFNNVIWHTFLHAMGISDSKQVMLLGVLDDGLFWFKCPTHDTNLL
ncbi:uncharacterized protein EDB91DRAFT_1257226 [Suillus paluster]|uniref:uncharacterized protein n=1 Tax=Suillus paluster TaxID=48578 RepID=UPI001B87A1EB|nr:uncharacterized protein EDB91DRAFT_1257226 [Suillus paluster]KAG1720030.1 hypothetical protein EDB91DRAFT_1257226 [Suillus paluster]